MARITSCSSCFNPVFASAESCPHCGVGRLARNRPRLLTRRNWLFILAALVIFTCFDSFHLVKRRNQRELVSARQAERAEMARGFLVCFFSQGAPDRVEPFVHPGVEPAQLVARARQQLPENLGDDLVLDRVSFRRWGTSHVRVRAFAWTRTVTTDKLVYDALINDASRFWKVRGLLQVDKSGGPPLVCDFSVEGWEDLGTTVGARTSSAAQAGGRDG